MLRLDVDLKITMHTTLYEPFRLYHYQSNILINIPRDVNMVLFQALSVSSTVNS